MKKTRLIFALLALFGAAVMGCSKSSSDSSSQYAHVSFVNAAPRTSIQILLGGLQLVPSSTSNSLPFPQYLNYPGTIAYATISAGITSLQISGNDSSIAAYGNIYTVANTYYTVYTFDTLTTKDSLKVLYLKDNYDTITSGYAKVRFLQFSPSLSTVDVVNNDTTTLFSDIPYIGTLNSSNYSSLATYTELAAGTYNLKINSTGTSTTLISSTVKFDSAHAYTIFAKGLSGGTTSSDSLGLVVIPQ